MLNAELRTLTLRNAQRRRMTLMVLSWEDGIFLSMKLNRGIAVAVDSVVVAVVILVVVEVAVVAEEETMVVAVDSANLVTFP